MFFLFLQDSVTDLSQHKSSAAELARRKILAQSTNANILKDPAKSNLNLDSTCQYTLEKAQELINSIKNGEANSENPMNDIKNELNNNNNININNNPMIDLQKLLNMSNPQNNNNNSDNAPELTNPGLRLHPANVTEITYAPQNSQASTEKLIKTEANSLNTLNSINNINSLFNSVGLTMNHGSLNSSSSTLELGQEILKSESNIINQDNHTTPSVSEQSHQVDSARNSNCERNSGQNNSSSSPTLDNLKNSNSEKTNNTTNDTDFLFKAIPNLIEKVQLLYHELEQERTKRSILESKVEWMTKRIDLLEQRKQSGNDIQESNNEPEKSRSTTISPIPQIKKAENVNQLCNSEADNQRLAQLKNTLANLDKQKSQHQQKIDDYDKKLSAVN